MVALHQACQSIRTGESNLAIVGGSQLLLHPDQSMTMNMIGYVKFFLYLSYIKTNSCILIRNKFLIYSMMNPDGKCYPFDSRGSGYARGEGVGSVILKRLDLALKDNDPIHAVIVNSGVNQDGRTLGIHLPSFEAQATLAESVYQAAGIDPSETLYVEAHGTGTQAGDAVEISSIEKVFCNKPRKQNLYVGSIKSNIGHLESTSGIAGFLKTILVLKYGAIPPSIDFIIPKPSLKLEQRSISIPKDVVPLAPQGYNGTRRASLNGFGYGGTNAHIILENAQDAIERLGSSISIDISKQCISKINNEANLSASRQINEYANGSINGAMAKKNKENSHDTNKIPYIFLLSAASESALNSTTSNLINWIPHHLGCKSIRLSDLAFTLAARRSQYSWRRSVVASSSEELVKALKNSNRVKKCVTAENTKVAFVFTGQGAQWYAMGRELLYFPVYKASILKSAEVLKKIGCSWDLFAEILANQKESRLDRAEFAQPATTALQIALVDLLARCGIVPSRVCGHSSGEIAAAYASRSLSQESAIKM